MDYKIITIIAFSYFYGFFELFMSVRQRFKRKRNIVTKGDKGSTWILIISIGIGYFLSFRIATMRMGRMPHWDIFFLIGIVLILIGMIIRIYSIKTLSQQFTYTVTNIEDHKLIKTGLYKNIRHPGYLGQIIIFTATAIALSNWLSILAMLIPVISGYLYRISIEEKFLIKQLGQEYIDYQKETRKLIPKIF